MDPIDKARIEQYIAELDDHEFDGMVARTRAPKLDVKELVDRELKKHGWTPIPPPIGLNSEQIERQALS